MYYCDLLCGVFTELLKLAHYALVIYVIGISFSLIAVYVMMRMRTSWVNIRGNFKAYISYRQIYQALNHQYEDAKPEELIIRRKRPRKSIPKESELEKSPKSSDKSDSSSSLLPHSSSQSQSPSDGNSSPSSDSPAKSSSLLSSSASAPNSPSLLSISPPKSCTNIHSPPESDDDIIEYETCGICRDEMREAKKLPCSHKFHLRCLMGWMRYKQTCPICRRSLQQGGGNGDGNNDGNGNANGQPNAINAVNNNAVPNGAPPNGVPNVNNVVNAVNGNNGNAANNNADMLPWWLRLFGSFIQIHNVDIIEARRGGNNPRRRNMAAHRPQPNINTEAQISRISEILGGRVSDQDIRTRLLRTHSMERTIEFFLANPR